MAFGTCLSACCEGGETPIYCPGSCYCETIPQDLTVSVTLDSGSLASLTNAYEVALVPETIGTWNLTNASCSGVGWVSECIALSSPITVFGRTYRWKQGISECPTTSGSSMDFAVRFSELVSPPCTTNPLLSRFILGKSTGGDGTEEIAYVCDPFYMEYTWGYTTQAILRIIMS